MYGGTGTCAGAFNTCDSATTGTSIHPTGCLLTFSSSLFATIETKANRVFSKISSALLNVKSISNAPRVLSIICDAFISNQSG